ncbi:hypothetical protein [Anaerosporobacter sp.]
MKDNVYELLDKIVTLEEQTGSILVSLHRPENEKEEEKMKIFDTDYSRFWFDSYAGKFYVKFYDILYEKDSFEYSISDIKDIIIQDLKNMTIAWIELNNGQSVLIHINDRYDAKRYE